MRTWASGAPASAMPIASIWAGSPTPASTSVGTPPGSRYVLLPVGPVQADALPARRMMGFIALGAAWHRLPVILQPRVNEIAFTKAADEIAPFARKPARRSLERDVVPQLRRRDAPDEPGPLGRAVDTEYANVVLLSRETAVAGHYQRKIGARGLVMNERRAAD